MNNYSVIILSYNKIEYLIRTAPTIAKIGGHEIILCDDCSNDGCYEWAMKSKLFQKIWKKDSHTGYALNTLRNQGVSMATFDNVILLDADCIPEPGYFEGHDENIQCFGKCLSVGFTNFYDERGVDLVLEDPRLSYMIPGEKYCNFSWHDCFGGNICFSKKLWNEVGGFDEEYNGYWGYDDIDFGYRVSKLGVLMCANRKSLVKHIRHPQKANDHSNLYGRNQKLFISKHGNIL